MVRALKAEKARHAGHKEESVFLIGIINYIIKKKREISKVRILIRIIHYICIISKMFGYM